MQQTYHLLFYCIDTDLLYSCRLPVKHWFIDVYIRGIAYKALRGF